MLFSSAEVANYINTHFEAAWETVRPVPMLTIDFGNGKTITRTLHGNIATYVCNWQGNVTDVVPGIYTPDVYLKRLDQAQMLYEFVHWPQRGIQGKQPAFPPNQVAVGNTPDAVFRDYHRIQAEALKANQAQNQLVKALDKSKEGIESPIKMMAALKPAQAPDANAKANPQPAKPATKVEDTALLAALAEDTRLNETVRREQIHGKLARVGFVKPDQLVKWLYKDVLHADLDDPYLGLGEALFKSYPFAEEDATTRKP